MGILQRQRLQGQTAKQPHQGGCRGQWQQETGLRGSLKPEAPPHPDPSAMVTRHGSTAETTTFPAFPAPDQILNPPRITAAAVHFC